MIRIVYISGRFRHYRRRNPDVYDWPAMEVECADEHRWGRLVWECGGFAICPVHNSWSLEHDPPVTGGEFIERDIALIRRLRANWDIILMREGWDVEPVSEGAHAELICAENCNLLVAHTMHGEAAVRAYLADPEGVPAEVVQ